jgi:hypothetical protein
MPPLAMTHLPLRDIRKFLGRVERAAKELKEIQDAIPLPPPEALDAMIAGNIPFSEEAYALAVLQYAQLRLEEGTLNVRGDFHKENFTNPLRRQRWQRVDIDLASLIDGVRCSREDS